MVNHPSTICGSRELNSQPSNDKSSAPPTRLASRVKVERWLCLYACASCHCLHGLHVVSCVVVDLSEDSGEFLDDTTGLLSYSLCNIYYSCVVFVMSCLLSCCRALN